MGRKTVWKTKMPKDVKFGCDHLQDEAKMISGVCKEWREEALKEIEAKKTTRGERNVP